MQLIYCDQMDTLISLNFIIKIKHQDQGVSSSNLYLATLYFAIAIWYFATHGRALCMHDFDLNSCDQLVSIFKKTVTKKFIQTICSSLATQRGV